jgi:Rad3-related DNA helicase
MTLRGKFGDPITERDVLSAKRFNFFALIVLIVVVTAGFLIGLQLLSNQRQLEQKTQQLADSTANLRRIRSELEAAQRSLAKREESMELQLQNLSNSVEKHDFDSAMLQANAINTELARHDSMGLTLVHLYSWKPQEAALKRIKEYLHAPEFMLVRHETLSDLPLWLGDRSAVYYYSPGVRLHATKIAAHLSKITDRPFVATAGVASDAPDYAQHVWLHIHYLGENPPVTK